MTARQTHKLNATERWQPRRLAMVAWLPDRDFGSLGIRDDPELHEIEHCRRQAALMHEDDD